MHHTIQSMKGQKDDISNKVFSNICIKLRYLFPAYHTSSFLPVLEQLAQYAVLNLTFPVLSQHPAKSQKCMIKNILTEWKSRRYFFFLSWTGKGVALT